MPRPPVPSLYIDFIRRNAHPQLSGLELTKMFNAEFGTSVKVNTLKQWRRRFAPGSTIKRGVSAPVGAERKDSGGYTFVRVAGKTGHERWQRKNRLVWESHYGPCPRDHIVAFLDNDITNFSLDNLMAVSKKMDKFMRLKKIPRLILKDPEMVKTVIIMHQLCHQRKKIRRASGETKHCYQNLPPLYQPVGRPGFAY